jgi:hypothetical protein
MPGLDVGHRVVFVGGLHRSGTSILARSIAAHPSISAFSNTGVPEDEGQHLQTVFLPAYAYGSPGTFAFNPEARLTEASPLVGAASRERLFEDWSRHWDLSKPILWVHAHRLFASDAPHLDEQIVVRYEDFVRDPQAVVERVWDVLGLPPDRVAGDVDADGNRRYFERWQRGRDPFRRTHRELLTRRFERAVLEFGYSLRDVGWLGDAPALAEADASASSGTRLPARST